MKIILLSGKAESGKDTFHKIAEDFLLERYNLGMGNLNVVRLAFADAVKEASVNIGWNGVKDEKGRSGLIMVGNGAREYFDANVWIKKVIGKLDSLIYQSPYENRSFVEDIVFVTDCRYENEVTMLRDWANKNKCKSYAIRVERPFHKNKLTEEQRSNLSETALDDFGQWDFILGNEGTYDDLVAGVENIMLDIILK